MLHETALAGYCFTRGEIDSTFDVSIDGLDGELVSVVLGRFRVSLSL